MNAFLVTIMLVMIMDVMGKALVLYTQDFMRKPVPMIWDLLFTLLLIIWAAVLLGRQ